MGGSLSTTTAGMMEGLPSRHLRDCLQVCIYKHRPEWWNLPSPTGDIEKERGGLGVPVTQANGFAEIRLEGGGEREEKDRGEKRNRGRGSTR